MVRPVTVVILIVLAVLAVGLVIPYLMKLRSRADDTRCQHNLRELAWFTADPGNPNGDSIADTSPDGGMSPAIRRTAA